MSLLSWLRGKSRITSRKARSEKSQKTSRWKRYLPNMEALEQRLAPATIRWVDNTPGPGDFFTASGGTQPTSFGPLMPGVNLFTSIQAAVAAASPGDLINVADGTYNEFVLVNKTLIIQGNQFGVDARAGRPSAVETILDQNGLGQAGFNLTASNVIIDGFTVQNSTAAFPGFGVILGAGTSGAQVLDNIIQNNISGISLANTGATQARIQFNLIRNNNQPGAASGHGIYTDQFNAGGTLSNVLIDSNAFINNGDSTNGAGALGFSSTASASPATNITISNNTFDGNARAIYAFNLTSSFFINNDLRNANWAATADIRLFEGVSGLTISGNLLQNGAGRVLRISNIGTGSDNATNVTLLRNSISGYTGPSDTFLVDAGQYTGTLNASGNWWGTALGSSPATTSDAQLALIENLTSGPVQIASILSSGSDAAPSTPGFQLPSATEMWIPRTAATTGLTRVGGVIQKGVDAALTGMTVRAAADTYRELVQINKTISLLGNQANVDPRGSPSGRSGGESILDGFNQGGAVQILSDNVVVNGFTIQNVNDTGGAGLNVGIWTNPSFSGTHGGHQILYNILQNNIVGLELANDGTIPTVAQFNLFQNNNNPGPGSGDGIRGDFDLNNAVIDQNKFVNHSERAVLIFGASTTTFSNNDIDGRGIGVGGGSNLTFTGNSITGGGATGISLVDITGTIAVSGNTISDKTTDGIRILGLGSGTVTLANNTITGNDEGVRITDYATVDLTNNTSSGNTNDSFLASIATVNLTTGGGADSVTVNGGPNRFAVTGGNLFQSTQYSGIGSLNISTLAGDDELSVDFSGGNPVPSGGISFNGGGNAGDNLVLSGGAFQTETFSYANLHDGAVALDPDGPGGTAASLITYTGLAPISSSITAADVILDYGTASETITVADSGTAGQTTVSSTSGETTTFANPTNSLTMTAGDVGDDIVNVNSFGSGFNAALTIDGGTGNDAITINTPLNLSAPGASLTLSADTITVNGVSITASGTIALTAERNIVMTSGSSLTANGDVTLQANTAGTATGNFIGINVNNATVQSAAGSVLLQGRGGNSGSSNVGVEIQGGGKVQTTAGSGTVTVIGTGGAASGTTNYGVFVIDSGSQVTSGGGNVSVTGSGGGAGFASFDNHGVMVQSGGVVSAGGNGTVAVTGTGGLTSGDGNTGVYVFDSGAQVTSAGGNVFVSGTGGGTGGANEGVRVQSGGVVSAGGSGSVTVTGTGGASASGGASNFGVDIVGSGAQLTSGGGNVSVSGTGGGIASGSGFNPGVAVRFGGVVSAGGNGTVTVTGTGGAGSGGANYGVFVFDIGSQVTSGGGNVSVTGTGGSGAGGRGFNSGVQVESGGVVSAGGSGTVTVTGTGGADSGDFNVGVDVFGSDAQVTSAGGNVSVTGQGGGSGASINNYGVSIASAGTVTAGGSGTVTITGTGGSTTSGNIGVLIDDAQVTATGGSPGPISVTGQAGDASSAGILLQDGGFMSSAGNITLTGASSSIVEAAGSGVVGFVQGALLTTSSAGGTLLSGANTVSSFNATNSGSGDITLVNTATTLTVTGISEVSGGNVSVTNTGNLSFASALNGAFTLTASATGGNLTLAAAVGTTTALTSLSASGNTIAINGGSVTTTGMQTYNDPVTLGAATTLTTTAGGNLNLNSTVDGAQSLNLFAGSGNINLGSAGTATPLTSFTIASVNNVTAGAITAGAITQSAGSGTSTLVGLLHATGAAGLSLSGNNFSITGGITVDAGPASITDAGTLAISTGPVNLGGNTFTIADTGAATVSSAINGAGGALIKNVGGTLTLTAANGYTGATTINAGTLLLNGSTVSNTTINSGATLGGTGSVNGTVTANSGGTVAPGTSPGILHTGSVNFTAGSTFNLEIGGTTAGNYDQLNVTGSVTISTSATLSTTSFGGFVPGASNNYIIINNDGSDAITGNFSGLPESAIISTNFLGSGLTARITYQGGDGNDVAIVVSGGVTFDGDNTGENFELRHITSGGNNFIQLLRNGVVVDSRPSASVTGYTINGNGGSDTLTVNYSASAGFFTFPVVFHGGLGDFDKLVVTGGTFTTVTHTFTITGPEHSGNLLYNTGTSTDLVTYDGLEPVDMSGSTITDLVFNLPGADDQAIVEDDGTLGNGIAQIRSQNAAPTFDTTTFSNPGASLTINMGGDSGTLTFGAADFTRSLSINGQAGTDNVVFQSSNSITALSVIVAGSVTDAAGTTLNVANNATFTVGSVVLGDNPSDTTNTGSLTFVATGNVSISEDSHMDLAGANSANTLTLNAAGNINVPAGASLTATTSANFTSPLVINGGNMFFTGAAVTATDIALNAGNLQAPNATGSFLVSGNWTKTGGTFNPNNGTVTFTKPAGVQTIDSGGAAFNNIAHTGAGTVQLTGNPLTINGTLTLSAGVFYLSGFDLTMNGVAGNFSNDAAFRLQGGETITGLIQDIDSGFWEYVGVSNVTSQLFTIKDFGGTDYFNLLINATDGLDVFETGANLKAAGTLTVQAGTFDANGNTTIVIGLTTVNGGTYLASFATQSLTGGLTVASGAFTGSDGIVTTTNVTLSGGTLTAPNVVGAFNLSGNWTASGGTFNANGGTVILTGGGTQTVNSIATFNNLQHTGTGTVQVSGTTLNVAGNLTNAAGAGNFDANGQAVTVTGATTLAGGTYLAGTGTQSFNGGLNVAGGTFSGSTGTVNAGDVNITSGTLTAPTGAFNVAGNWFKGGGAFDANGGTVTFTAASGTQTLNSGDATFNNVSHTGAGTLQVAGTALTLSGTLTNAGGAGNLDANSQPLSVAGLTTITGGVYLPSTGLQTLSGGLTINGGTLSSVNSQINAGNVSLLSGTLTAPNALGSFHVNGNWTVSGGTLNANGGTVTFTAASATQTVTSGGRTFNNVQHSGAGTLVLADGINLSGSLTTGISAVLAINGGSVTSAGAQAYNEVVTLGANAVLTSTGGVSIAFASTVNGGFALTVNTAGATTFAGPVGGITPLTSLTTDAAGSTALSGGSITTSAAQTYNDAVTLGTATTLNSSGDITFGATVDGSFSLTVNTGATTAFDGVVGGTTALVSLSTDGAGTTAINGGGVRTTGSQTYDDAITLGADALLTSGGSLSLNSTVDLGAHTLAVADTGPASIPGNISGTGGSLVKDGGGTLTLSGNDTYTGTTTINAGTLLINGSITSDTTVNAGTLGGTGKISGTVLATGTAHVAPGSSPGILNTGSATFASGSEFDAEIGGPTAGTGADFHDQLNVSGTVTIAAGVALVPTSFGGYIPQAGDAFRLINNDGGDAITGTFAGLPEGGVISTSFLGSGRTARITYRGGDGNDVAIVIDGAAAYNAPDDGLPDSLELRLDTTGTSLQFLLNGVVIDSRPLASVTSVTVTGAPGAGDDDTLTVNYTNGFFAIPVTFHGGTAGTDSLVVTGGTFSTVTHTFTTAGPEHSGNIRYNTATSAGLVSYDGLEPVDMTGSSITDLVFNLPGANDQAVLEDDGLAANGISQIRSQNALPTLDTTSFAEPSGSLTVNMGGDSGTLTVASLPDFASSLFINGEAGTDDVVFQGTISVAALTVSVAGTLTDAAGASLSATGNVSLTAGSVTLADNVTETLTVGGNASFSSGSVTVAAAGTVNFGSLTFSATGAVSISEDSSIQLAGANSTAGLILTSAGALTEAGGASLTVTSNASVSATSITLGSGTTDNFGTLTFNSAGPVSINESSATRLSGSSTGSSLSLSSAGAITDVAGSSVSVTGNANFSGTSIALGAGSIDNFGSLTFNSGGAVSIAESSATQLAGTSTAGSLALTSPASITDVTGTSLTVTNNASFSGSSIVLGDNASDIDNFGTLTFSSAGIVSISEDSSMDLAGANSANSLTLTAAGAINVPAGASLSATTSAAFNSPLVISGGTATFGSTAVTAGDVTQLGGTLTAPSSIGSFSVSGDWFKGAGVFNANGGTVTFTRASGTQTLNSGGAVFNNITHSGAGVLQLAGTSLSVGGAFANAAGAGNFDANGQNTSITGLTTVSGNSFLGSTGTQTFFGGLLLTGATVSSTGAGSLVLGSGVTSNASAASSTISGNLNLGGAVRTFTVANGSAAIDLDVSAAISNGGGTLTGGGTLRYSGGVANSYTGTTTVHAGILLLAKAGVTAVAGNLVIGDGVGGANADVVRLALGEQIADTSAVTIQSSGLLDLTSFSETIGSLAGSGNVTFGTDGIDNTLTVGNATSTLFFGQFIGNDGGLDQVLKVGTATLTLSDVSPFTGRYTINQGILLVNGSIASSTQAVTVNSGATLGGLGTISRAVNVVGGTVAPGTSPGILNTASVTFVTGSSFNVEIGGPTPGNGAGFHDQLNVTGTVAIGTAFPGVTLNVTSFGGFVPSGGQAFRIINNDGSDPIVGNFAGLPEGAVVSTNFLGTGQTAHITYKGGDGNDIALIVTGTATYSAPDDGLPDTLELRLDSTGTNLEFLINGVVVDSRLVSAVTDVVVNGADGPGDDDTLIINYTNGFFAIPVAFHGGADATDALIVTGGSFVTVTHTFVASTPEHSGNILYDTGTSAALISYDGLEPVDMTGNLISNLIFNLPGAADNAILEDDGLAGNLVSRIRSQAGNFETTTFANTVGNLLVNMGGDSGTLTVGSLPDFANTLSINGQGGTDAVVFQGTTSFTELNVSLSGSITDAVGASLTVSGQATLNAGGGVITLGDNPTDTTNFGSLNVTGGSVTISEDSASLLTGVNAGGLTLTSAGDITDAPGTTITVSGVATFNAGANAITLGDDPADITTFGSLTITGGAVTISTDAATQLAGTNQASTLTLTAAGDITDAPGTTIAVTGLATFNAGGNAITLGDSPTDTTNFGSLSVSGGAAQISEGSDTVLTAVSAGSLTLFSSGTITDAPGTTIAVSGTASFNAGANAITIGDNAADTTNFGSLNVNGGAVAVSEDSATELAGSNIVASLTLTSAGAITDAAGTFLFVSGAATLNTGGNDISLGNSAGDAMLFGTLSVTGGGVTISSDTSTQFAGVNTAASLTLNAAGTITDAAGTTFAVSGLATFNAGTNAIMLGDSATDTTNFGSLNLSGGSATITEDSASDLAGASLGSLTLNSAGTISVTGKVTATGAVQLVSAANVVVNAAIDPTTVALQSNDDIVINAAVTATNSITLLAGQDGTGGVSITGTGALTTTNAGSTISMTTGSVSGAIALAGNVAAAGQITLNPRAGNTTQTGGTLTAVGLLLTGAGAFQLTQTGNDVDTIAADLNPGSINFRDVDDLTVGSVGSTNGIATGNPANGGDVVLVASGLLTVNQSINTQNGSGGTVTIGGGVVVNAPLVAGQGNIVLNGGAAIGDLIINSPIIQATTINLSAQRDIIVAALVQTTTPTADIILVADSDGDGIGGVWIQVPGKLDSGRNVAVEGSDLFATPASVESIRIDNDAANDQIVAVGNITLTDRSGAFVPAAADTIVSGIIRSSGPGAVSISARHDIQLSSTIGSAGGPITLNDPVVLAGDAAVSSGAGDVTFTSTINGNHALTINSGGFTNLQGVVGGVTPLASLTTDAGGTTRLGANISTQGATTFNDAVQLLAELSLTAGSLAANGTVDGAFDLTLAVTGATNFVGAVGGTTPLGDGTGAALRVNSNGATEFQGTVHIGSGLAQADTAGAITFRQDVTIAGGDTASTFDANVVLDGLTFASDGAVRFGNSAADGVTISGGPVTITLSDPADALNILAGVNLGTPLTINDAGPATISGQITGASSLNKNGGGTLTITGNNTYSGGTNLNAGTLAVGNNSALGTGTAALNGGTLRADGAARTLGNALAFGGNFTIGGTFDLTFNGLSTLTGDRTVTVSNSGLTTFNGAIRGTVAGNEGLTLQGSGAVTLGTVGTIPLEFLALPLSGQVTFNGNITTDNNVGSGLVDLSAATGGIRLGSTITINTDAAGNGSGGGVSLSGSAVNAATAGGQGLTVNAPAGNLTLGGAAGIGAANALSFLTISNAGNASFGGIVNTTGNLTQTAGSGTTTLRGGTIGGNLDLTTNAIAQVGGTLAVGTTAKLNPLGGGVNQTGGALIAPNLLLTGAGTFSLNQSGNNVNIFAANVTGPISYQEANGLTIGTVNGTNGIQTHNNNLGMTVGGSLTADQPINVGSGNMIAITVGAQTAGGTPVLVQLHNAATVTAASATITARSGGADTLQGPDRNSGWTITANGGGNLANSNYSTAIHFQQFESLHGGTLNDAFVFSTGSARITGLVDGDFGFDTLNFAGIPNASITVTGPGSKDGFQGNGSVVAAFDNINARGGSVAFAVSTGDSQVYVHLFDPAGNPLGNWNLVAPGQFLSVVSGVVGPDRAPIVFGLGIDHRIYAARFRADGSLAFGWFLVAPGFFNSMAVSNYGANSAPIVFGLANAAGGNQVYAARFDAQGNFQVGWYLVAPGSFTYITAGQHGSGGAPELFGISNTQVYAASFDTNANLTRGWFFVAPGSFKQLTVSRRTDGTQELFGLGTNSQVYAANFDTSGNLTTGWFGTAPGQFFAIAAGPVGGLQGLNLATDQSIHRRFFAATFDSAGQQVSGWTVLNNGPYQPVSANNAVTAVFALEANESLFDDSIYTNGGFFKLPPGPFKSLSVVS